MRKLLAGFLATTMICSMATMVSAASSTKAVAATGVLTTTSNSVDTLSEVILTVDGKDYPVSISKAVASGKAAVNAIEVANAIKGTEFKNVVIDGKVYQVTLGAIINGVTNANITATFSPAAKIALPTTTITVKGSLSGAADVALNAQGLTTGAAGGSIGSGDDTADIEITDDSIDIEDVVVCDGEGNPIPLVEKDNVVGGDRNNNGGVQGSRTVYFMIKDGQYKFGDDSYWKLKVNKGDNGKYVKAISDVTKNFGDNLYNANEGGQVANTGKARYRYIKVEMNDIYTDDEYKISLDMRLTAKDAATRVFKVADSTEIKVKDFTFYVKNIIKGADNDWKVGVNGLMLEPLENDWNNVTWYDEDGDLAHLKFFADSDVDKFYSKLSTKWDNADYASYFNDQDAFKFEFTGSPNLSATSRADVEIYNPFVDEDGNETIDPATAVIYSVVDGELFDVSDSFTYTEGDNGDMAYKTRTRFLGTYIICEKAVEEASDEVAPDEIAPDEVAPDEIAPDAGKDNGGKAPANTGRYL